MGLHNRIQVPGATPSGASANRTDQFESKDDSTGSDATRRAGCKLVCPTFPYLAFHEDPPTYRTPSWNQGCRSRTGRHASTAACVRCSLASAGIWEALARLVYI